MSKLLKLKKWLSLDDAAKHLSTVFDEQIQYSDVLQLALEGHISLSVNLVNMATAKLGHITPANLAKVWMFRTGLDLCYPSIMDDKIPNDLGETIRDIISNREISDKSAEQLKDFINEYYPDNSQVSLNYKGELLPDESGVIEIDESCQTIDGIWDLAMVGSETLDIEHYLMQRIGGPEISKVCLSGVYLIHEDGKTWAQLQESYAFHGSGKSKKPNEYYPMGGLPEDSILVVRQRELQRFIQSFEEQQTDKPVTQREETTYLNIIGGLLHLLTSSPSRNQESVKNSILETFEGHPGISKSTLENKFAAANRSLKISR